MAEHQKQNWVRRLFDFLDTHSPSITALASLALVLVTGGLVYYAYEAHQDTAAIINEDQATQRPYVHTKPDTGLDVFGLKLEDMTNESNVAAQIIYLDEFAFIATSPTSSVFTPSNSLELHQLNPEILYSQESTPLNFPNYELSDARIQQFHAGKVIYITASCIIYKTPNTNDAREWEDDEVWTFTGPNSNVHTLYLAEDNPVANETTCDPSGLPSKVNFR